MLASAVLLLLLPVLGPAVPAAEASPLREIGQDRTPPGVCGPLVVHANAAIAAELHDREWLTQTIARLRSLDVEGNALARRNALADLTALSAQIHEGAEHGVAELSRLGDAAERMAGAAHREDLRLFSAALSTAFGEQHRLADDLAAFIRFLDNLETRGEKPDVVDMAHLAAADPFQRLATDNATARPLASPYQSAGSPNHMARAAATDFAARLVTIAADESRAAAHSEGAVSGCS